MNNIDKSKIRRVVYDVAAKECEGRERSGSLQGNGHHMAQRIESAVGDGLAERLRGQVLVDAHLLSVLVREAEHQGSAWRSNLTIAVQHANQALAEEDLSVSLDQPCVICRATTPLQSLPSHAAYCTTCSTVFKTK